LPEKRLVLPYVTDNSLQLKKINPVNGNFFVYLDDKTGIITTFAQFE